MAVPVSVRVAAVLIAVLVPVAGCAESRPGSAAAPASNRSSPEPTAVVTSTPPGARPPRPSRREVRTVVETVRRYLAAWAAEGPARASRYLVPDQRTTSDEGAPRIGAGTVTAYHLNSWSGPGELTVWVAMDLTFTTSPMAWNRGANERFVTAHRVGHRYLLELATSP